MLKDKLNEIENDSEEITGINITPLVDVMLVLLIIFMVTASYIVSGSIKVVLPEVSSVSEQDKASSSAVFLLDKENTIYFEGKIIQLSDVEKLIKDKKISSAIISADRNVLHGSVIELMDVIKKAGVSDFSVDVESKK